MKAIVCAAGVALLPIPAAAQAPVRAISATEKAQGAQAHPQLLAAYGGAYRGPQAALVDRVARRVAVQSGLGDTAQDFTVTLLDSPQENAFAIPGGYIYVTRQLLALVNSEDELAGVLGHEIGHVAARHSTARSTRSTLGSLLAAGLGAVTGSQAVGRIAGYGTQLYTLRYGRTQEYEADALGVRYATAARYSPYGLAGALTQLEADSNVAAQIAGRNAAPPVWASTHPNSLTRIRRAQQLAQATGQAPQPGQDVAFLRALDGMAYDGPTADDKGRSAADIAPKTLRIVTVRAGDTSASLAQRMAYPDFRLERFLALNGLDADTPLRAGMLVKVVVAR